jgi:hypothetical protein
MSVGAELRDPWGWLLAGVSGGVGWAVLAGAIAGPAAILAGVGIGAAVLATKVVVGSARTRDDQAAVTQRPRDRLPEAPRGTIQAELQARSRAAIVRMDDLADRPADPWIAGEVQQVLAESQPVADSIREMAGRVTLLDSSIVSARPEALAREIQTLQDRIRLTSDDDVLREQQRALQALDSQADSVDRLLRRREALVAQMQTAAVGLEGLAARIGELVALGPASQDTAEAARIVADLTTSLDAVRAGVDEARSILRDL